MSSSDGTKKAIRGRGRAVRLRTAGEARVTELFDLKLLKSLFFSVKFLVILSTAEPPPSSGTSSSGSSILTYVTPPPRGASRGSSTDRRGSGHGRMMAPPVIFPTFSSSKLLRFRAPEREANAAGQRQILRLAARFQAIQVAGRLHQPRRPAQA